VRQIKLATSSVFEHTVNIPVSYHISETCCLNTRTADVLWLELM